MTKSDTAKATALQEEIQQTRAELGQTVQALAARADVPSRARTAASRTAHRTARRARHFGASPTPWLALATGSTAALLAVLLRWRRR